MLSLSVLLIESLKLLDALLALVFETVLLISRQQDVYFVETHLAWFLELVLDLVSINVVKFSWRDVSFFYLLFLDLILQLTNGRTMCQ